MFKGYKTFIVAGLTVLLGVLGKHVAPDVMSNYADVIIAGLGVIFASLRVVTASPIFQHVELAVANILGLSPEAAAQIAAQLPGTVVGLDPDDKATISSAAANLNDAVDKLTGHPLMQPDVLDALLKLSEASPSLLGAVSSLAAPAASVAPALAASGSPASPVGYPANTPIPASA